MGNSTFIKMATVMIVLNVFMYLGVNFSISAEGNSELNKNYNFRFNGDLIDIFMGEEQYNRLDQALEDTKNNWTSYDINADSAIFNEPSQQTGEVTGDGGINFLDSLKIMWAIVPTLANVVMAPLTLFFNFDMPVFLGFMIGLPYLFLMGVTFYAMLGGRE